MTTTTNKTTSSWIDLQASATKATPAERNLMAEERDAAVAFNSNPTQQLKVEWLRARIRLYDFQSNFGLGHTVSAPCDSDRTEAR